MLQRLFRIFRPILATVISVSIVAPVIAQPPPWAPAHGYRNKHKNYYDYPPILPWHDYDYTNDYILDGRCDRERLGAVLGGVIGGVTGSQIGKGSGRTAATIAGTVLGVIVGRSIGRHMDSNDLQCTGQALEHAPDRAHVYWHDPDMATYYRVTPVQTYRHQDGRYCREYIMRASIGGQREQVYGHACRQPDGTWALR